MMTIIDSNDDAKNIKDNDDDANNNNNYRPTVIYAYKFKSSGTQEMALT